MTTTRSSWKPTTSAAMACWPLPSRIWHSSPTLAFRPSTSMARPMTLDTRPMERMGTRSSSSCRYLPTSTLGVKCSAPGPQQQGERLLDLAELRTDLCVDGAVLGVQHAPAGDDTRVALDSPFLLAVVRAVSRQPVRANGLHLRRVHLDGHPRAAVDLL